MRLLFVPLLFIYITAAWGQTCTHYASNGGSGSSDCTVGDPCNLDRAWTYLDSIGEAGKVLCLNDGTYTGSANMIDPPSTINGTSGSPLTIKAVNDGSVLIDGQDARIPALLAGNDYISIIGINAANSSGSVWAMGSNCAGLILQRVGGWDACGDSSNCYVFAPSGSDDILIEDSFAFGTGRKMYQFFNTTNVTVRRAWGRWEGNTSIGPKMTFSMRYDTEAPVGPITCENCIGTWSGEKMTALGGSPQGVDQPYAIFGIDNISKGIDSNSRLLGSIAYIQSGDDVDTDIPAVGIYNNGHEDIDYDNVVVFVDPSHSSLENTEISNNIANRALTNAALIGGSGSTIHASVATSDVEQGATINDVSNIFNESGGAEVCFQIVDRSLTATPLWPWPMNSRIIAAMTTAGYTPVDVTATIESIFGAIPAACRSDATPVVSVVKDADPAEPSTNGQFTLSCDIACASLSINCTMSGTATPGSDYTAISCPRTITDSEVIALAVLDDDETEDAETVIFTIDAGSGYTIGTASATATIPRNDYIIGVGMSGGGLN